MIINTEELLEDSVLLSCRINDQPFEEEIHPATTLLDLLRDQLRKTGTHMGCMTGHCGACTVMVDGRVIKSCIALAASMQRKNITTIEGVANKDGSLHPVQEAFSKESGFQCGYCSPGMVLTTVELLKDNPNPTEQEIRKAITGTLCRCTGYQSIVRAVSAAAQSTSKQEEKKT